jgi:hypothetical protein
VATRAFAVHRAPALFLQIATEFASVGSVISPSQPIQPGAEDKLAALRRLDKSRAWNSLDDQLYCTVCKNVISGRQIAVVGGTNGLRALHIKCSTPGCLSTPADWLLPVKSDTVCEIDGAIGRRQSVDRVVRNRSKWKQSPSRFSEEQKQIVRINSSTICRAVLE